MKRNGELLHVNWDSVKKAAAAYHEYVIRKFRSLTFLVPATRSGQSPLL